MDYQLTEEQQALRTQAREFLSRECPTSLVRELEASPTAHSDVLWRHMAKLGWMGITYPEPFGGADAGFMDQMVVVEEMGRSLLLSPYFTSVILSGYLLQTAGDDDRWEPSLRKLIQGDLLIAFAFQEPGERYDPTAVRTRAVRRDGTFVLSGTKTFVPYAHVADRLLCLARTSDGGAPQDGLTLFLLDAKGPGVTCNVLETLADDKQCAVVLDGVEVPESGVVGQVDQAWASTHEALTRATALKSAEMVGAAQKVLEITVDYAKHRVQFGRPIGAFQSIQNYVADMAVDLDRSRFMTYQACWKLDQGLPAELDVSCAKAYVSDAYQRIVWLAHQIHASIAYYKEHDLQIYYRRAKVQELELGDAWYHRGVIGRHLGLDGGPAQPVIAAIP
ncbi:MAG: acyl-CoA/acyl-ACP dehydrogenase [Chloroflexi bacterium]|nr:acyl-CoA/acyl-ACP dehydrogenase [Chloroflexota bacterium]